MAVYTDDFNRADGSASLLSGGWEQVAGGSTLSINGNRVTVSQIANHDYPALIIRSESSVSTDKQFVEIENLAPGAINGNAFFGGYLSASDAGVRSGYVGYCRPATSNFAMLEVTGSSFSALATGLGSTVRPFRTRFERDGLFLRLYKDDVLVLEHEITGTPLTGTRFGLVAHSAATMFADNFEGGDLASVTTTPALGTITTTAVTSNSIGFSIPVTY